MPMMDFKTDGLRLRVRKVEWFSDFEFQICFGFRLSDFEFPPGGADREKQ
jgi:hypothetical protein